MFKNSFYYTLEKLIPKLLSLIVLPILLRLIKPELWAEITLLLAIQLFLSYFLTLGDERSILMFTKDQEIFSKSVVSLLRISILIIFLVELLGYFVKLPFSLIYGMPFRLMIFSTVLISLNKLFISKLRTLEMATHVFKSAFFESLLIQSLQLLLIALTVELDGYDSRVIVTSFFLVQFLGNLLKLIYFSLSLNFNFFALKQYLTSKKPKDFLKFSNINFLILITGYFLNWQDRFFVEYIYGLKDLGVYSVSLRVSNLGTVFISSLLITLYAKYWPKHISENLNLEINKVVNKIFTISSLTFCTIMVLSASIGKYILPMAYHDSVDLIYLSSSLSFLQIIVMVLTIDLGRQNKLKKVFYFNILTFSSQFLLFNFYEFNKLEEIFYIQILTIIVFLISLFFNDVRNYLFLFFKVLLLFLFSIYISTSYLETDSQMYQIILFVSGILFSSFILNLWIKLESKNF